MCFAASLGMPRLRVHSEAEAVSQSFVASGRREGRGRPQKVSSSTGKSPSCNAALRACKLSSAFVAWEAISSQYYRNLAAGWKWRSRRANVADTSWRSRSESESGSLLIVLRMDVELLLPIRNRDETSAANLHQCRIRRVAQRAEKLQPLLDLRAGQRHQVRVVISMVFCGVVVWEENRCHKQR